jgi:DNA-binding transcriptional MocR family regulator
MAAAALSGLNFNGDSDALHGWLELPKQWRAESFTAVCANLGIAVAPGSAFAVNKGVSPTAVRIAYSASDLTIWAAALKVVAELAQQDGPR